MFNIILIHNHNIYIYFKNYQKLKFYLNLKPIVIIQARQSSKRLPNKVILPINYISIIEIIYRRVFSKHYKTVVAISIDKSDDLLDESFRFVLPGYNVRPLELEGVLGVEQLKKLPMIISERRKNAKLFVETLSNHPDLLIQKEVGMSSWFGFSIIIRPDSSLTRKELVNKLNH